MTCLKNIDIIESEILNFDKSIIENLLIDRTTKKNIIWATDEYEKLGELYKREFSMSINLIVENKNSIIKPRILKSEEKKMNRTKNKAEVFTPSWICNAQNNLVDLDWFEEGRTFNVEKEKTWIVNEEKIIFKDKSNVSWKKYVDALRMEITCGEAPYLVSRYDTTTGKYIDVKNRIGLLDRKLRIVNENTDNELEWYKWVVRAFQSIYGFEFQGDNLLLARENLLYTFIDNVEYKFNRKPKISELEEISNIISWNIWQMDGLYFTVPFTNNQSIEMVQQLSLFQDEEIIPKYCVIKDWQSARKNKKSIKEYRELLSKEVI